MPGTPVTMTWWDNHIVGNQGYLVIDGSPGGGMDDTFLCDLRDPGSPYEAEWRYSDVETKSYFRATGATDLRVKAQPSGVTGIFRITSDEAGNLDKLENGVLMDSSNFITQIGGSEDWSSTTLEWLGTCLDGGCAGEPHFVGFDKSRFDYQGISGHWYTLMNCPMLRVSAEFTELDPTAFGGTTFMTAMRVRIGDDRTVTLRLTDFPDIPVEIPANQILNLDRGLVRPLQTVEGTPTGTWVRKFPGGELAITCLIWNQIKFLNLGVRLIDLSPQGLTGILGQTLQPRSRRVANDTFDEGGPE